MADEQFAERLNEFVGDEIAGTAPVTNRVGLAALCAKNRFRLMGVRLKSGDEAKEAKITDSDWVALRTWLWGVANIEQFHPSLK